MRNCSRCTAGIAAPPSVGNLYLLPPAGHATAALRAHLGRLGEPVEAEDDGIVMLRLPADRVVPYADRLVEALSPEGMADTRVLLVEDGAEPSRADLMRSESLGRWLARQRARYVSELIEHDRLTFHFQPIVHGLDPGTIFGHECLVRGLAADGSLIPPNTIYRDAREAGLLFQLDRAARLAAIRQSVALGLGGRLFINFNPSSIYDPATCLRSTAAAIAEAGLPPGRVTFEIVESEQVEPDRLSEIVRYYRSAGFRVALDDLGAGFSSLNLLNALRPDFVKLDRELTQGVDLDPYKACVVAPLIQMARDLGIEIVAEGVETAGELAWLRDRSVDYIQGFLIARPGLPPFSLGGRPSEPARPVLRIAE